MKSVMGTGLVGALVVGAMLCAMCGAAGAPALEKPALPIIPGAAGFGIQTPAGSGRHLLNNSLEPGWNASLVGHWNFDDGTDRDNTANKNDGKLVGGAAIVVRDKGRALRLDGKGACLDLANARGYMKPGSSLTVMAWVCLDAPEGSVAENAVKDGGYWRLGHTAAFGGKWHFMVKPGATANHAEWHDHAATGIWRHVAGVYDGATGRIRLYVNGTMVHNGWNKKIEDFPATQSCNLTIGKGAKGIIDDIMLFDRPLTPKQIAALFASRQSSYFPSRTEVYRVINLNDSGPGSLREGVEGQERARTIVFEVSGTIALKSSIFIGSRNCYLTIAGATAPSPGITVKNHGFEISGGPTSAVNDVFIQHIRLRTGDEGIPANPTKSDMPDPLTIDPGAKNIVVDHCSLSWGTDMNLMTGAENATFSNLISSEALGTPLHPKGPHSKGFYVLAYAGQAEHGGENTAIIQNLIAFNVDRNPTISAGSAVVANNYLYDCGPVGAFMVDDHASRKKGGVKASVVANAMERGALPIQLRSGPNPESRFHLGKDNMYNGIVIVDAWKSKYVTTQYPWPTHAPLPAHKIAETRDAAVWIAGYEPMPVDRVKEYVLKNAGARPTDRDAVDERIIANIRTGKGKVIASQKEVGGWPSLAENRRELKVPENPDAEGDGDGYTNLEKWLHALAAKVEGR